MGRTTPVIQKHVRSCSMLLALLLAVTVLSSGCGTFIAKRMVQSPNRYPTWFVSSAPVLLAYDERLISFSPVRFAEVGPPSAHLQYRVVEPADYHLQTSSTNWVKRGKTKHQFTFRGEVPPQTNIWTANPRGTVFLLHGYSLSEFSMAPWAWQLAQEGWRCVLVDLRGHGDSTGKTISWGLTESRDMAQLLDILSKSENPASPVAVIGESYGAALALRWKTTDPRVGQVVAIAPYGVLSNAVLNICHDYAGYLPKSFIRAGLKQLPTVLGVQWSDLDTSAILARNPVKALFITGDADDVIPSEQVRGLFETALPGSKLIVVPGATHETVPYRFNELLVPVLTWLNEPSTNLDNHNK